MEANIDLSKFQSTFELLMTKIIEDIKNNKVDTKAIEELNYWPIIDELRKSATFLYSQDPSISHEIKRLLDNDNPILIRFCISILSRLLPSEEVGLILDSAWEKLKKPEDKIFLVYYFLNLPENIFSIHKQQKLYMFMTNNWKIYLEHSFKHLNINNIDIDSKHLLDYINKRFEFVDTVPLSKAWIYLLLASVYPEKNKFQSIIEHFRNSSHPIVREVIETRFV